MIGAVLGLTARLAISALQVAGSVVAQQLGLASSPRSIPTQNQQGLLVGNFLTVLGVTLIFATDLHHLVIAAMNDSYTIFQPGEMPIVGDVAQHITRVIATSFRIGIQLSAPFLVFGLLFNLGLGVLSRLMPQMQVFFIGLPLSILLGFLLLVLVIGAHDGHLRRLSRRRARRACAAWLIGERAWPKKPTPPIKQKTRPKSAWTRRSSAATWSRARRSIPGSSSPAPRWC